MMWLSSVFGKLAFGSRSPRAGRARRPAARFRPQLEALEDRTVPSTLHVTNLLDDGGTDTLRYAVNNAASGDTIDIDTGTDPDPTITLNPSFGPIRTLVGVDLTISGTGSARATISGGDLTAAFFIGYEPNTDPSPSIVTFSHLNIEHGAGNAVTAGGITLFSGTLSLEDCYLSNNQGEGGAIRVRGDDTANRHELCPVEQPCSRRGRRDLG